MKTMFAKSVPWFALSAVLVSVPGSAAASPRSERVAARVAERAYARQAITEARAVQAEARAAQIAPLVPVPPPPRPATLRRLARAGVPLPPPALPGVTAPPAAVVVAPAAAAAVVRAPAGPVAASSGVRQTAALAPTVPAPRPTPRPVATAQSPGGAGPTVSAPVRPGQPAPVPPAHLEPTPADVARPAEPAADPSAIAPDGTRSVLVLGEEPAPAAAEPASAEATIELLPVPEPR